MHYTKKPIPYPNEPEDAIVVPLEVSFFASVQQVHVMLKGQFWSENHISIEFDLSTNLPETNPFLSA